MSIFRFLSSAATALALLVIAVPSAAGGYGHHGYYGHYGYGGHYRHHRYGHSGVHIGYHAHGGGDVAVGVLAGVLLGYAILNHRRNHYADYRPYRYQPRYRTTKQQPVKMATVRVVEDQCVQEDDYLTTVIIDGQAVEAWGVACQQPDGSWRRKGVHRLVQ